MEEQNVKKLRLIFHTTLITGNPENAFRVSSSLGGTNTPSWFEPAAEAAPAAGSAEIIVDITSTGATLKANDLKILQDGVILKSQAALSASLKATWSDESLAPLRTLLDGVAATARAQTVSRLELANPVGEYAQGCYPGC